MSRVRLMIRNPTYGAAGERDHQDEGEEIDPIDIAPLESCSAPIVTAPASEDESSSQPPEDGD